MQVVGDVRPCICGDIAFSAHGEEVHVLKSADYLIGREALSSAVDLLCEVLVQDERQEAGEKVSRSL